MKKIRFLRRPELIVWGSLMCGNLALAQTTFWPQTFWHSLMTKMSLQKQKYDQAFSHSVKALENDPMKPELHINLGNSLEGLGAINKAKEAYGVAEKVTSDTAIHFQARFNQAQALAKEKKIDEALALYQKALEIDPNSREAKTNIELLMSSGGGKGDKGDEENKDQQEGDGEGKQPKEPKKFAENPQQQKKQPQNLSQSDVKKILDELKQQEQRIRGDYYKQGQRDQKQKSDDGPREKDW